MTYKQPRDIKLATYVSADEAVVIVQLAQQNECSISDYLHRVVQQHIATIKQEDEK